MFSVFIRAFSFTLVILIGVVMRSTGLVAADAGNSVKKFLIYVTLPCAIITNFSAIESMGMEMVLIAVLGIVVNVIMIAVGAIVTRKRSKGEQAMYMLCLPAFNIGAFCLPFVQSFLPALGSVTACMFDVGNSVMCTGGHMHLLQNIHQPLRKNRALIFVHLPEDLSQARHLLLML